MVLSLIGIGLVAVLLYLYVASKKTDESDMVGEDPDIVDVDLYLSQQEV